MDMQKHWQATYQTKDHEKVSWYSPHLETSLALIQRAASDRSVSILDVGGGPSTLVDDLVAAGYDKITVLDIAPAAIEQTRKRLGPAAQAVEWIVGDITTAALSARSYDVWHDRAVFHFLTEPAQRAAYVRQATSALKPGGHVILGVFAMNGPQKCSGVDVVRYSVESLQGEFGAQFRLIESSSESHRTPFGTSQPFVYCCFQLM